MYVMNDSNVPNANVSNGLALSLKGLASCITIIIIIIIITIIIIIIRHAQQHFYRVALHLLESQLLVHLI